MNNQIIKVKHFLQRYEKQAKLFTSRLNQIKISEQTFYVCIVENVKTINDDVILIIGSSWIGYDKQMYEKYPYFKPTKYLHKVILLQLIIQPYIQQDHRMSMQYLYQQPIKNHQVKSKNKKTIKQNIFQFNNDTIRNQFVVKIINAKDSQRFNNIKQHQLKNIQSYSKQSQMNEKNNRDCKILQQQNVKLKRNYNQMKKNLKEIQLQINHKDNLLIEEAQKYSKQVKKMNQQIQKKREEKQVMIIKQKQNKIIIEMKQKEIQSLKLEVSRINQSFDYFKSQSVRKQKYLQTKIDQQKDQKLTQIKRNKQLEQKISELQKIIEQLKLNKEKLQSQQQKSIKQNKQLYKTLSSNDHSLLELRQIISRKDQQIMKMSSQLDRSKQLLLKTEQERNEYYLKHIFKGSIFDGYIVQAEYLISTLEQFKRSRVIGSKLLYSFDPLNKTNFHHYIDHHSNLLIIIKTSQNAFIAGFSQSPFDDKRSASQSGFISSLTNRKVYLLEQGRKSVSYDEYFIIFGNSEIRIRSQELLMFSNFGISTGFYPCRNDRLQMFLCSSQRDVKLEDYEVYRIDFQM